MALSKSSEKLLIEMYKHEDNVVEYLGGLFEKADSKEDTKLRSRLKELRESGMVNTQWADNVPYIAQLTHIAEDYLVENELIIMDFDKNTLRGILDEIKLEFGFINIFGIYEIENAGRSQISWRQNDDLKWDVRFEMSDMLTVKKAARALEEKMKKYGYTKYDFYEDDSIPRFKLSLSFEHQSLTPKAEEMTEAIIKLNYNIFLNDFISSCLELQANKPAVSGSEDDKTVFIRSQLTARKYDALDQTLRGQSASGIQSGEVDLLILDNDKTPFCIVEALCLNSVDKTNIDSHINKITKYDANGLMWNIVLSYVTTADFNAFTNRYVDYAKDAEFEYPLANMKDISNPQFSEVRVFSSSFKRSGMDRKLTHILLKMPD